MKSVRVEPLASNTLGVDVVCDCGRNCLKNARTGQVSFRHPIRMSDRSEPVVLACECGARYEIVPQTTHVHVNSLPQSGT